VSKQKPEIVICPYCSKPAVYANSAEIYGRNYGKVYLCKPCNAYVGVHKGTTKPKGSLANKELREWRIKAHASFDALWSQGEPFNRNGAYQWLANQLSLPRDECHIGMFDVEQCKMTVNACAKFATESSCR